MAETLTHTSAAWDSDRWLGRTIRSAYSRDTVTEGKLVYHFDSFAVGTTYLQLADVIELFDVPANTRLVAIQITATDMDTGTPALVFKLKSTTTGDLATGLTGAQAGGTLLSGNQVAALIGKNLSGETLSLEVTTAAATAAAGTLSFFILLATPVPTLPGQ